MRIHPLPFSIVTNYLYRLIFTSEHFKINFSASSCIGWLVGCGLIGWLWVGWLVVGTMFGPEAATAQSSSSSPALLQIYPCKKEANEAMDAKRHVER